MDFLSAVKLAKDCEHLIGEKTNKGVVEEIIIMPTDEEKRAKFIELFRKYMNAQKAIALFTSSDVEVYALFKKKSIRTENCFITCNIHELT